MVDERFVRLVFRFVNGIPRKVGVSLCEALLLLLAPLALAGCASWGGAGAALQKPETPPASSSSAFAEVPKPGDPAVLSSVEEFLLRTKEYSRVPAGAAGIAGSSDPRRTRPRAELPADGATLLPIEGSGAATKEIAAAPSVVANGQVTLRDSPAVPPRPVVPTLRAVSVRIPLPAQESSSASPPVTRTTNEPLDMKGDDDTRLAERMIASLRTRAAATSDLDAEWALRLTELALQRDDEALAVSASLPAGQGELLAALIRTAIRIRSVIRGGSSDAGPALAAVDGLRASVAERADPEVAVVALCRRVLTFGVYEELAAAELSAGRANQAIVYCEIRNLRAEQTEENMFRTRLSTRLELLTASGRSVWQHEEPEILDLCRQPRRDFFIAHRVTLPAGLASGEYVLKVMIEDKIASRADEGTASVSLIEPGSVAKGP